MRRLLARLFRRAPVVPPSNEADRLLRIYRETVAEMQELRRAA